MVYAHPQSILMNQIIKFIPYSIKSRTYKLNMENECPFWAQQRMCNSNKCSICECSENEIPVFWKKHQQSKDQKVFDQMLEVSSTTKDCPTSNEWCHQDEHDSKSIYVNLEKNKESYTAYDGMEVWRAIYKENCMIEKLQSLDMSNTCSEETLLYQLISGFHASVNMHVSKNFFDQKTHSFSPNHAMYLNSLGLHPDRIKNLFFLYAVILRAINRASPILNAYDYDTQLDKEQDKETPELMKQILAMTLSHCEEPFKEKNLFIRIENDFEQEVLLKNIQTKFYNISRILDCVGCEKCRLNGKLQMKGVGTAMKLLFSTSQNQQYVNIKRTEIIALVNTLFKLSESLEFYREFKQHEKNSDRQLEFLKYIVSLLVIITAFLIDRIRQKRISRRTSNQKLSNSGAQVHNTKIANNDENLESKKMK
eukprot:403336472